MKISLLILLGLTMAFMVQTGEAGDMGSCNDENMGTWKGGESRMIDGQDCKCPWGGGQIFCSGKVIEE